MTRLTEQERLELKQLSQSEKFKQDLKKIKETRINPCMVNGKIDVDLWIKFLTEFNEFINHEPKPFKKIIDTKNKL